MSPGKKLVVVTGATGAQGFPIAKYLLSTNRYSVRAVTRKSDSPQAVLLKDLGAEVVRGDYDIPSTLAAAVSGADAVFCNTNFWDRASLDEEVRQGLAIAKATAGEPSVKNFIYSYLPDPRKILGGKYHENQIYKAKAITLDKIEAQFPELYKFTTKLSIGYYHENWLEKNSVLGPVKGEDGVFEMTMPYSSTNLLPMVSPEDAGVVIATILDAGDKYHGKWISLVTEHLSDDEKLAQWAKVLGVQVKFNQISPEKYQQRLEARGYPKDFALYLTHLCLTVSSGVNYFESDGIIKARDIVDPAYTFKTWEEYVAGADWSSILRRRHRTSLL